MKMSEQSVLDELSRGLDLIEKTTPMIHNYARIDPKIIEVTEGGIEYRFIVYHKESEEWFNQGTIDYVLSSLSNTPFISSDDVVFDLGCNSGYHTVWFAKYCSNGHVYAFDPVPWNAVATRAQAKINACNNVTAYSVGLGFPERTIDIVSTTAQTYDAHIAEPGKDQNSLTITVHLPERYLYHNPTFLKMDIEGAEIELAKTGLFSHPSIQRGYVEMHKEFILAGGGNPNDVLHQLVSAGYTLYFVEGSPIDAKVNFNPVSPADPVSTPVYFFQKR
ncbi:MAG: FkbM family methyltransferase [Planctomycetes bacterium]|nr:FkbM family methyltransferase [Planctomycetota bacterium]